MTLQEKVEIIKEHEEHPEYSLSKIRNAMFEKLGRAIAKTTIQKVLKNKDEIRESSMLRLSGQVRVIYKTKGKAKEDHPKTGEMDDRIRKLESLLNLQLDESQLNSSLSDIT